MMILALVLCALQIPDDDAGLDLVMTADGMTLRGEITGCDAAGFLTFAQKEGGRTRRLALEDVVRIRFGGGQAPPPSGAPVERARLFHGAQVTGRIASYRDGMLAIEGVAGPFVIRRSEIQSLSLGSLSGPAPEIRADPVDVMLRSAGEKGECIAEYGELKSIGEKVVFAVAGVEKAFDRAAVKQIQLHHAQPPAEMPPGWFARISLRNGDRWIGLLRSVGKDRAGFFCHPFGTFEVEKRLIQAVAFVPRARQAMGHVIVCEQNGLRSFDRAGKEVWSLTAPNVQYGWSAQWLENGRLLVASQMGQVMEIERQGRGNVLVIWSMSISSPTDASRLENGNTLVAEQGANRVAEYDARTRSLVVWKLETPSPSSAQRLENGNTLVCTRSEVVEYDAAGVSKWRYPEQRRARAQFWKAQRLENGNTLVTDSSNGQVIEVDPQSREVWRMDNLSQPMQAIRMEDGNTLILEQGSGRMIEVDPSKRTLRSIDGLNRPQGMAVY